MISAFKRHSRQIQGNSNRPQSRQKQTIITHYDYKLPGGAKKLPSFDQTYQRN